MLPLAWPDSPLLRKGCSGSGWRNKGGTCWAIAHTAEIIAADIWVIMWLLRGYCCCNIVDNLPAWKQSPETRHMWGWWRLSVIWTHPLRLNTMEECFYMFPRIRTAAWANPLNISHNFRWSCLIVADIYAVFSSSTPLHFSCYEKGLRLNSPVNAKNNKVAYRCWYYFFFPPSVSFYLWKMRCLYSD